MITDTCKIALNCPLVKCNGGVIGYRVWGIRYRAVNPIRPMRSAYFYGRKTPGLDKRKGV